MRRVTSLALAATLAVAGGVYVFGPSFTFASRINGGAINSGATTPQRWSHALDFGPFVDECQSLSWSAPGAVLDAPIAAGGCGSVLLEDDQIQCTVMSTGADFVTVHLCCLREAGCADLPAITFSAAAP